MTSGADQLVDAMAAGVRRILSATGQEPASAGATAAELREAEKRLGVSLPPVLRAFYRACGGVTGEKPGQLFAFRSLSELALQEVEVESRLRKPTERHKIIVIRTAESAAELAAIVDDDTPDGSVAERSAGKEHWVRASRPLCVFLLERAAWQATLAMPHQYSAHVPRVVVRQPGGGRMVKERIADEFTPIGTRLRSWVPKLVLGETAYCDEDLHALLVRLNDVSEEWTHGCPDKPIFAGNDPT